MFARNRRTNISVKYVVIGDVWILVVEKKYFFYSTGGAIVWIYVRISFHVPAGTGGSANAIVHCNPCSRYDWDSSSKLASGMLYQSAVRSEGTDWEMSVFQKW